MLMLPISGRLPAAARKVSEILGEELDVVAGAILEHERETAGGADAGNRRRREAEGDACRDLLNSRFRCALDDSETARPASCGRPRL